MKYVLSNIKVISVEGISLKEEYISPDRKLVIKTNGTHVISTPFKWDGMTCYRDIPEAYEATLIHDIQYTYLRCDPNFPLTRKQCDKILIQKLAEAKAYSAFERNFIIYPGVRLFGGIVVGNKGKEALLLENYTIRIGSPYRVYNKGRKATENKVHVWVKIQDYKGNNERWLRFTEDAFKQAEIIASRNPEDQPSESVIRDLLT